MEKKKKKKNAWTLLLDAKLQGFNAPYSDILDASETDVAEYKYWATLSAGSAYLPSISWASKVSAA